MSRAELEARRRALLARREAQRAELAWRLAQLNPRGWARAAARAAAGASPGRHPLGWLMALAGVLLVRKPRYALSLLGRTRSTLTLLTRTKGVLSLLGALRKTILRSAR
jgi:hypothetical protein